MATWEDGPEYAPLERPSDFATPSVAPLEDAPPVPQPASWAPLERPGFDGPSVPLAPLAALVPDVSAPRDPQLPFDVASTPLTAESAWGALQPSLAGGPPGYAATASSAVTPMHVGPVVGPTSASGPWGPPATAAWPAPAPPDPRGPHDPMSNTGAPSGFPAPGTPGWFGPGPYAAPPASEQVDLKRMLAATTPGVVICLVVGGLIFVLAPLLLGVALGLSSRVTAARSAVRRILTAAVAAVGLVAVVGALTNKTGFADWWDLVGTWSLALCWISLVIIAIVVYRDLRHPPGSEPGPRRATWG